MADGGDRVDAPKPGSKAWWQARLQPARRDSLSIERITSSAVTIIDRDGPEALTMRRVAEDLGVAAPSLYRYVESREALLVEVLESVLGEINLDAPAAPWRKQAWWLAHSARNTMVAHPGVAVLLPTVPMLGPNATAVFDAGLRVCQEAGMSRDLAIAGCQAAVFLVRSFVVFELAELERLSVTPGTLVDPDGSSPMTAADELFEFLLRGVMREIDARRTLDERRTT